jgi:hypothetical protein
MCMWATCMVWNLCMTKINIKFDHTWHDHPLTLLGYIDDQQLFYDQSGTRFDSDHTVNLNDGPHTFRLIIEGKTNSNVLIENDKTVKDTFITMDTMVVDNIDLSKLMLLNAKFYPKHEDPKSQVLEKIVELGYNGEYVFEFKTPLYEWVLEKLY